MPYIDVIEPDEAEGELRNIYNDLIEKRGKIAEVHKIQSLNPESIIRHMDLYLTLMYGGSPLKRAQREMIGVVVSAANDCKYCQLHHGEALNHYWKDRDKIDQLCEDYAELDLDEKDRLLCSFAKKLTLNPGMREDNPHVQPLKEAGFTDRAILDATLIVSYFNFVNRTVLALGVEADDEEVSGYYYE